MEGRAALGGGGDPDLHPRPLGRQGLQATARLRSGGCDWFAGLRPSFLTSRYTHMYASQVGDAASEAPVLVPDRFTELRQAVLGPGAGDGSGCGSSEGGGAAHDSNAGSANDENSGECGDGHPARTVTQTRHLPLPTPTHTRRESLGGKGKHLRLLFCGESDVCVMCANPVCIVVARVWVGSTSTHDC